jgi:hypothetical protein
MRWQRANIGSRDLGPRLKFPMFTPKAMSFISCYLTYAGLQDNPPGDFRNNAASQRVGFPITAILGDQDQASV